MTGMENAQTQDLGCQLPLRAASIVSRRLALAVGTAALALGSPAAQAAGTLAGTDIVNVAQATYDSPEGGTPITIDSNKVTIKVDELLDVTSMTAPHST